MIPKMYLINWDVLLTIFFVANINVIHALRLIIAALAIYVCVNKHTETSLRIMQAKR